MVRVGPHAMQEWRDIHDWLDENCPDWTYNVQDSIWEHPSQRHDNLVQIRNGFARAANVVNQKPIFGMIRLVTEADVTKVVLRWNAEYVGRGD